MGRQEGSGTLPAGPVKWSRRKHALSNNWIEVRTPTLGTNLWLRGYLPHADMQECCFCCYLIINGGVLYSLFAKDSLRVTLCVLMCLNVCISVHVWVGERT